MSFFESEKVWQPSDEFRDKSRAEQLEIKLRNIVQELYEEHAGERRIRLCWPWVLIRALPKEQKIGELWVPEKDQQKVLYEGIVISTWEPQWRVTEITQHGLIKKRTWMQSDFVLGDRILYPHFAGLPIPWLDEKKYRIVREWTFDANGGALGIVHHDGDSTAKEKLEAILSHMVSATLSGR